MLHFKEHANRKAGQEAARSAGKGKLDENVMIIII